MEENKIYFSDFFDVSRTIIEDYGAMDISLLNDREFYGKTCTTYTLMFSAFTVTAVEVFLMPGYADLS